jgi:hypothetical protein
VKECYEEFFSDYIDEVLAEKIPEYISQISASVKMEAVRWKEAYGEIGEEEQRAGTVIDFLTQRREFLNQVWLEDAELATVHFVAAKTKRDTYMSVIRGECLEAAPPVDQDYQDEDEGDKWYTADGEEFDITEPIIEDMTVYADRPEASAY